MTEFEIKVDEKHGVGYIPKKVREAFGLRLKVVSNYRAAALFPEDADVEEVLESLEVLRRHFLQVAKYKRKSNSVADMTTPRR